MQVDRRNEKWLTALSLRGRNDGVNRPQNYITETISCGDEGLMGTNLHEMLQETEKIRHKKCN